VAKPWSYSEGEYGFRVRAFERPRRRSLYISYWDETQKKLVTTSLGHADREQAINECRQLSDALRLGFTGQSIVTTQTNVARRPVVAQASAVSSESTAEAPTWEGLLDLYHERRGRHKKGTQPTEDLRRQKIWKAFFAQKEISGPSKLDEDAVDEFIRMRRKGELEVAGVALRKPDPDRPDEDAVTPRTIEADIVYLVTVLNWATKRRQGRRLIDENPIGLPQGLKTPEPRRPVATHDDVRDLRRVADKVDSQGLYGCFVRLHDAFGWRVTAICNIKASDVSLTPADGMPYGSIRKNPKVDKESVGQRVPLSRHARATLKRLLRIRGLAPGQDAYLFAAPKDERRPWSRWRERDLRKRAEKEAGIGPIGGSHAVRRKWVSERKDHPIPDLMVAGGWTSQESLESYLRPDPDTTYEVVSRPTRRIRRREG
jgi:hypothetical protein